MRLVPKNLRNYLQTPTLIGCRFLTNPEATYRLLRLALLRSAKPCSLAQFLKNCQLFSLPLLLSRTPQPLSQDAEAVQRSLRLCTVFSNRVNFEGSFFLQGLRSFAHRERVVRSLLTAPREVPLRLLFCVNTFWVLTQKGKPNPFGAGLFLAVRA